MDPIRKIPNKITKKIVKKVNNRQYFHRKTGLETTKINSKPYLFLYRVSQKYSDDFLKMGVASK